MKWPTSVAPYDVVIIPSINKNSKQSLEISNKIYKELLRQKIDVLLDDVDESMSVKFKKHDLIGIPYQIIIGSKSEENRFEFREVGKDATLLSLEEIKEEIKN